MTFIIIRNYWTRKYDQILAVHTCTHLKKVKCQNDATKKTTRHNKYTAPFDSFAVAILNFPRQLYSVYMKCIPLFAGKEIGEKCAVTYYHVLRRIELGCNYKHITKSGNPKFRL